MAEGDRVRIRIHGCQRDDAGALHESRTQAVGRHDAKGGKHFFRYEDHALLEFVPQEERTSLYRTPYGMLHLAVRTKELFSACRADGTGRIELIYDLFVEGRFQSSNELSIEITNA